MNLLLKKREVERKKKTLDINQDDVIVIDLQRDDNIKSNILEKISQKIDKNDNTKNNNKITEDNKNNNIPDLSNDLILHIKSNNTLSSDISGASIDNINHNSLAPFNNVNNEAYNINNFLSYKILDNNTNKNNSNTKKTNVKNIFSFIKKENNTSDLFNTNNSNFTNTNTDTNKLNYNIEYDINNFNRENNINSLSSSNNVFKNNQDTLKENINKIKYAFDNNRKWLSKTDIHCLWCCHNFESVPIAIPKKIVDDTFHLFGYFCSFNCAASYIFGTNILASNKWEYYSLLCLLRKKITGSNKYEKIKLAPPKECLKIFGGFLSIDEFREQFNNIDEYTLRMPPMVSIESTIENSIVK